ILGGLFSHYELFWIQTEQQICRLIRLDAFT
ncbi:flagellar biosynthetic protein FliR, partial [Vibrio sp. 10N.222.48.A3]